MNSAVLGDRSMHAKTRYFSKLGLLSKRQEEPKVFNMIVLDWDDTLFPTCHFQNQFPTLRDGTSGVGPGFVWPSSKTLHNISKLENEILKGLSMVSNHLTKFVLMSDASREWINVCLEIYYPALSRVINERFEVISARDLYSHLSSDNDTWKYLVMLKLLKLIPQNTVKNLLIIGDRFNEIMASKFVTEDQAYVSLKTLKLLENPSLELITDQWQLIGGIIQVLFEQGSSGDFMFQQECDGAIELVAYDTAQFIKEY